MTEHPTILGGKVHVYKRPNSSLWQCSSYFAGQESSYQHKGRASLQSQGNRRGLVPTAVRKLRAGKSRAKRSSAKCLNTTSASSTSSRRDNATSDMWKASTGDQQRDRSWGDPGNGYSLPSDPRVAAALPLGCGKTHSHRNRGRT
jgi:hypothetical protein